MTNLLNRWAVTPTRSLSSELRPLVSSGVLTDVDREFQQLAAQHLAYRGNPDTPHLKVISTASASAVLSDCSTPAPVDPFTQYNIKTGKPLRTPAGGPYPKTITVLEAGSRWRVNSIVPNTSKVCRP